MATQKGGKGESIPQSFPRPPHEDTMTPIMSTHRYNNEK